MGIFDKFKKVKNKQNQTQNTSQEDATKTQDIPQENVPQMQNTPKKETPQAQNEETSSYKNIKLPHLFMVSNAITPSQCKKIIDIFYEYYDKHYLVKRKNPKWIETENSLKLKDEWEYYAGPDGTIGEWFNISIQRDALQDNEEWEAPKDWPCKAEKNIGGVTSGEDTRTGWVYYKKAVTWLLLEPFDIPGIWSITFSIDRCRILS